MKQFGKYCIDCNSEALTRTIDEVKPVFKMETVEFACGAVLKSSFTANGNISRASHSGCRRDSGL